MALSPDQRRRLLRMNMLMAYASFASSKAVAWTPATLFANAEVGGWYDPSDLTTMFQDAAGTTAAALESPVGLIRDKSGNGNHLSQSTSTARPVLSARVNLLTRTEDLSNAAWINGGISNGTRTNGSVSISNSEGFCYVQQLGTFNASVAHVISFDVTCDQTVSNVPIRAAGDLSVSTLLNCVAGQTVRVALSGYRPGASYVELGIDARDAVVAGGSNATGYTITFNRVDLRPSNAGVGLPAYQRVGAATSGSSSSAGTADYDATGFPYYLRFDGTDDFLQSATITPGADKAQVFAGVRKLSDANYSLIAETSILPNPNPGFVNLYVGGVGSVGTAYSSGSRGNAAEATTQYATTNAAAPDTSVLAAIHDISGDLSTIRRNGASGTSGTGDKGTGNFGDYPLYVGARFGTTTRSLFFNGHLYQLLVRFSATNMDAATITSTETWVNGKTRAY